MRAAQLGRAGKPDESQKQFDEAYDYFRWLLSFHPDVAGFDKALQDYLYLNSGTLFLIGTKYESDAAAAADEAQASQLKKQAFDQYAQAFAVLEELYSQDPQYAYGGGSNTVVAAMERVGDRLVGWYATSGNLVATRRLLVRLQTDYQDRLAL
ncbi:MAG: hypothetical protein JJ992_05065, partial [Planctomycetes bacterium]|nr:hypothetical protein [Planctomycetota bacterium]